MKGPLFQHGTVPCLPLQGASCAQPRVCMYRGIGHRKIECSSPAGFHPISTCIDILQSTLARSRDTPSKGASKGKGKGLTRGRGGAHAGGRGRGRFVGSGLYVDADGNAPQLSSSGPMQRTKSVLKRLLWQERRKGCSGTEEEHRGGCKACQRGCFQ
jgi:hypothetical protein